MFFDSTVVKLLFNEGGDPVDYVTPQKYGAIGDGKADDTAAFQKAVDSGFDVFVPTERKQIYRITGIRIRNKRCRRIFSDGIAVRNDSAGILADFAGAKDPKAAALFEVHTQTLTVGGLRIFSNMVNSHRAGLVISAMNPDVCDYDVKLIDCGVHHFYKVMEGFGRGFEIVSCVIASTQYILDLHWDDAKDSNKNHPAEYDQRGINIKQCRLHDIVSGFIIVRSGHAYGLHFEGNTCDNGKGFLIRAYDQAYGWNITGNVIQGISGDFVVMDFRKGLRNCVISGNTFLSDEGYWVGKEGTVACWLKAGGNTTGSVIGNNVFKNAEGSFLTFKNLNGTAITGNAMYNKTATENQAISITGKTAQSQILGNAIVGTAQA